MRLVGWIMRNSEASKNHKSAVRLFAVLLLASAAAGCSSDANRFNGLFSSKTDDFTTNSIPHQADRAATPLPRGNVASAADEGVDSQYANPNSVDANATVSYEPVNTAADGVSGARGSVTPMRVEKASLDAPSTSRQKIIVEQKVAAINPAKVVVDAKAPSAKAVWHVSASAPQVRLKSGETIYRLSQRYGVPEKELLRANGLKSASAAQAGQVIIIPTYGAPTSASTVKVVASAEVTTDLPKKKPVPVKIPDETAAVLPTSGNRDKAKTGSDQKLSANDGEARNDPDGVYIVKSGDSLARIAKAHGMSVDSLKQANGLTTAQLRIGQKLKLSGRAETDGATVASAKADDTKTGAIAKGERAVETAEAKPTGYKPPVGTKSVDDVEKSASNEKAPESTGISKYRWPVRGAVVAGYGANVEGERNTGIDISVPEGTEVKAAENGVVIYSGSGLKELGNTVLIRHDDGTVTVYGNASTLNVQRGQKVERGQVIAASGMSGGAKRPKLHFEVRKNASPVNPITYLE